MTKIAVSSVRARRGDDAGGVRAGRGFGDGEGLQPQLALGDQRQVGVLLLVAAVPQQRAHRVHLGVAGRGVTTRLVDLLHDHRGRGQVEPEAAVPGGDERGEQAGPGEGVHELLRVAAVAVGLPPVLVGEPGAERPGAGAQAVQVGVGHGHVPHRGVGPGRQRRRRGERSATALRADGQLELVAPAAGRGLDRRSRERRPDQPVRELGDHLGRGVPPRQLQREQGQQRAVHDEAGITLDAGGVGLVVVDAMPVVGQRAEPEQPHRVGVQGRPPARVAGRGAVGAPSVGVGAAGCGRAAPSGWER